MELLETWTLLTQCCVFLMFRSLFLDLLRVCKVQHDLVRTCKIKRLLVYPPMTFWLYM